MTLPRLTPIPPQPQPQSQQTLPRISSPAASSFQPFIVRVTPLQTAQPSIRFPLIGDLPSGFSLLTIDGQARGDTAAVNTDIVVQVNGDTGTNYVWQQLFGNNNVASSQQNAAATATPPIAGIPAATAGSSAGVFNFRIPNYGGTTFPKEGICTSQLIESFAVASEFLIVRGWHWTGTSAINNLLLFPAAGNFVAGSSFVLQLI
jgi:hypothetical protein